MPIDPYFTSRKTEEVKQPRKRAVTATQVRKQLLNPDERYRKMRRRLKAKGKPFISNGGHESLTGFKQPKKVWDERKETNQ